jgi:hypothetical protein
MILIMFPSLLFLFKPLILAAMRAATKIVRSSQAFHRRRESLHSFLLLGLNGVGFL